MKYRVPGSNTFLIVLEPGTLFISDWVTYFDRISSKNHGRFFRLQWGEMVITVRTSNHPVDWHKIAVKKRLKRNVLVFLKSY